MASKRSLMADGFVINRFKMLAHCRVRSTFDSIYAVPSTMIGHFEAIFTSTRRDTDE
jgi:hypothetical protein